MAWTQKFADNLTRADSATLGNGWVDPNNCGSIVSNKAVWNGTGNYQGGSLATRPTSENTIDSRVSITIPPFTGGAGYYILMRGQGTNNGQPNASYYCFGVAPGTNDVQIFACLNGSLTPASPSSVAITGNYNTSRTYIFDGQAVGSNPTTLSFTLTDTSNSTVVASYSGTDNQSSLQGTGFQGYFGVNTTSPISNFVTYNATSGLTSGTANNTATGSTTATVTVGTASGGTSPYTYQWYRSTTNGFTPGSGNLISGATSTTLNDTGLTLGTTYYYICVVKDATNATSNSNQVSVTTSNSNIIPANHSRISYYGRWNVTSSFAKTINCGSLIEFSYTGDLCKLTFDVSGVTSYPHIITQVDGGNKVRTVLASNVTTITLSPTYNTTTTVKSYAHKVKVWVAGVSENVNEWSNQNGGVSLTSITLNNNESLMMKPLGYPVPQLIEFIGDSITASVRQLDSPPYVTDQTVMDGSNHWPAMVADNLGCKPIVTGFGGTGITTGYNTTGVPATPSSFSYIYNGVSWNPTVKPSIVVIYLGTNESNTTQNVYQPAYYSFLSQVRNFYPNATIFAVTPLTCPGLHPAISGAVNQMNDNNICYLNYSTSGSPAYVLNQDTSDSVGHLNLGGAIKMQNKLTYDIVSFLSQRPTSSGGNNSVITIVGGNVSSVSQKTSTIVDDAFNKRPGQGSNSSTGRK